VNATTQVVQPAQVAVPNKKVFSVKDTFNVSFDVDVEGYDMPWDTPMFKTPARMPNYHWREDLLMDLLLWWYSGDRALKLIGHTGTGKTEMIKQFCAYLNLPLLMPSATPRTEAAQLIGGMAPSSEGFVYMDAALGIAARHGVLALIDEYNVIDPGEATGLNAFLEGNPYTIHETGETLVPHPEFRIVATQNPKTSGYRGRNTQDLANDDRFVDLVVPYMDAGQEVELLSNDIRDVGSRLPNPPAPDAVTTMAKNFVEFANEVRAKFMGTSDEAGALPCTMSTRTLRRWVRWTMGAALTVRAGHSAAHYALRRVLTNRQAPEVAEALHKMLEATTGELETGA
jgi:cobaltochelatase CobS